MSTTTKPELPPLPEPDSDLGNLCYADTWLERTVQAYGEACYRKAIEDAANACGRESVVLTTRDQTRGALRCMDVIRALIGEKP